MSKSDRVENERLEAKLLLEAIYLKYGYDFRKYSEEHTSRRLERRRMLEQLPSLGAMQHKVICDVNFFDKVLLDLSINVTEMFRDPKFFKAVREKVFPHLQTYPHSKIWHAGCSTGQEVYSMAIMLEEEAMLAKTQLYATDFNETVVEKAKCGIYPISSIQKYTKNYQQADGKRSFNDYYIADYESVLLKKALQEKILFSSHNLVTDGVFGEMNAIFCRNVLIYFNRELQNKVLNLFFESLCPGGFLCLGSKENIKFSNVSHKFHVVDEDEKIYRKKRLL